MPCSMSASVVPTGWLGPISPSLSKLVRTTPLPASTRKPRSCISTGLGWLYGSGITALRMSSIPSGASISLIAAGSMVMLWPPFPAERIRSSVWLLLMWAASSSARSAPVLAPDRPPIMCGRPIG